MDGDFQIMINDALFEGNPQHCIQTRLEREQNFCPFSRFSSMGDTMVGTSCTWVTVVMQFFTILLLAEEFSCQGTNIVHFHSYLCVCFLLSSC